MGLLRLLNGYGMTGSPMFGTGYGGSLDPSMSGAQSGLAGLPQAMGQPPAFAPELTQPEYGSQGAPFSMSPPNKPPAPQAAQGAQQQGGGGFGAFMKRLNATMDSPGFQRGIAMIGAGSDGSGWSGFARANSEIGRDFQERQRMENEARRQKALDARVQQADARQAEQFEWLRAQQAEAQARRQRLTDWAGAQGDNPLAAIDPEAAFAAEADARATANQPLTPMQREQLALQRQGLSIDAMRAQADAERMSQERPLRGADRELMEEVRDAAGRSQALNMLGDQFLTSNGVNGTGRWTTLYPSNLWDENRGAMRASSAQMRAYMRPPGSGATSDYEQRIYAMGVPSVENTGPQNQAIMEYHRAAGQIAQARRFFYEDYASRYGSLNGAEQAFQQSPSFRQVTAARPLERRQQAAPAQQQQSPAGGVTPEQARAELRRRQAARAPRRDYSRDTLR